MASTPALNSSRSNEDLVDNILTYKKRLMTVWLNELKTTVLIIVARIASVLDETKTQNPTEFQIYLWYKSSINQRTNHLINELSPPETLTNTPLPSTI